jgi:hypothetical protein
MIVIIPIHNQERNLKLVLSAYLNQTLKPKAVILVCDRCTDSSSIIANNYKQTFSNAGCRLHVIDTSGSNLLGFGAGHTRDVGIQYALNEGFKGPFLFSDGDCVPSPGLVEHHERQLQVPQPRVTCGLRYETVPEHEDPAFPLTGEYVNGLRVQDDLRLNASWCKHFVFGKGFDRLVLNPQVFEKSWICWSCNLGMNLSAVEACRKVNGIIDGDVNRVFNSSFDGRWGGEDGFVGLTMFRLGHEVVALHGRSYVTHIWHPRNHINQDHLLLVARKDANLLALCVDGTLDAEPTVLTGLRRLTEGAFDLGFLESTTKIESGRVLGKVAELFQEPFISEAIKLLLPGTLRYRGGIPTFHVEGDREALGKRCYWARSMMPWLNVAVNGDEFTQGNSLIPYQDNAK